MGASRSVSVPRSLGSRRRGTTIAAAAVSLALVVPVTQAVLPVESAQVAAAQSSIIKAPNFAPVVEVDAIANGYTAEENTVSGEVFVGDTGNTVPANTSIYLQWIDIDGAVSPTYKTTVRASKFKFDLREGFEDGAGRLHTFEAREGQRYRIWMDPVYHAVSGNKMLPMFDYGRINPGEFVTIEQFQDRGAKLSIGSDVSGIRIRMFELPDVSVMTRPESEWILDDAGPSQSVNDEAIGSYSGHVWLQRDHVGISYSGGTAEGDVVFSVLDEAYVDRFNAHVGSDHADNNRTRDVATFLKENPNAIAATVVAPIGAFGYFTARFPDGVVTEKNRDYIYALARDNNGTPMTSLSAWTRPDFRAPTSGTAETMTVGSLGMTSNGGYHGIEFAVPVQEYIAIDFRQYDLKETPVQPGQEVTIRVDARQVPDIWNDIYWKLNGEGILTEPNADGQQFAERCSSNTAQDLASCTFTVPLTARTGDILTAETTFHNGNVVVAADSIMVQIPEYEVGYAPTAVKNSSKVEVMPEYTSVTPPVDVADYKLAEGFVAPDGYSVDVWDWNGRLVVTAYGDARDEVLEIPIEVSFKNGASPTTTTATIYLDTDGDGIRDTDDLDDDGDGFTDSNDMDSKRPAGRQLVVGV